MLIFWALCMSYAHVWYFLYHVWSMLIIAFIMIPTIAVPVHQLRSMLPIPEALTDHRQAEHPGEIRIESLAGIWQFSPFEEISVKSLAGFWPLWNQHWNFSSWYLTPGTSGRRWGNQHDCHARRKHRCFSWRCFQYSKKNVAVAVFLYSSTYSSIPLSPPGGKRSLLGNTPSQKNINTGPKWR